MAQKRHSNLLDNPNVHHLYAIYDIRERELFKFGISDSDITADFSSNRLNNQLSLFTRVAGRKRFIGRILIYPIAGRLKARRLEDHAVRRFYKKHGRLPRGNPAHQFLKE